MISSIMDPILYNMDTLSDLTPDSKLRVDDSKIMFEQRSGASIMRFITGDGRNSIMHQIKKDIEQMKYVVKSISRDHLFQHFLIKAEILQTTPAAERNEIKLMIYYLKQINRRKDDLPDKLDMLVAHYSQDHDVKVKVKQFKEELNTIFNQVQQLLTFKVDESMLEQVVNPSCSYLTKSLSPTDLLKLWEMKRSTGHDQLSLPSSTSNFPLKSLKPVSERYNHDDNKYSEHGDQHDVISGKSHFLVVANETSKNDTNLKKNESYHFEEKTQTTPFDKEPSPTEVAGENTKESFAQKVGSHESNQGKNCRQKSKHLPRSTE